jgi:ParB-like nuclease domain
MKNFRASRSKAPSLAPGMLIVDRTLDRLKPDPVIPRHHSNQRIREIANGLKPLGFNLPILIDRNGNVIVGQDRLATCRKLGMTEVPTLGLDHRSCARARAFVIADNRRTQIAGRHGDGLACDLVHFDTIIRRWQALTGRAHHGGSGRDLGNLVDAVEGANAA